MTASERAAPPTPTRSTCLGATQNGPDQLFRINGTTGGGGPSCSGGAITINDAGPATPYPSTCDVSGMSGSISDVNVQINGLSHTYPDDIDMLLVSPDGQNAIFFSDAGGFTGAVNCDLTIDDEAGTVLPDTGGFTCPGSYSPAN